MKAQINTRSRRLSPRQALSVARERVVWGRRTSSWEHEGSQGLTGVVAAVLERCRIDPQSVAVDLGCGSGQVTLPLAPRCDRVLAVDVNAPAIELLERKARDAGITNIQAIAGSIQALELDESGFDLVVTNYALHHLSDADKRAVLAHSLRWLRPGGQLVIGDMMLGRGGTSGDREIMVAKIRTMATKGPAGWWRILKNLWRFSLRIQEKPLPLAAWERLIAESGFEQIESARVVQEACVVSAIKPAS